MIIHRTNEIQEIIRPATAIPFWCFFLDSETAPNTMPRIERIEPQQKREIIPSTREAIAIPLLSSF